MDKKLRILFVEDVPIDAELIWQELKKNKISFSKILVDNRADYLQGLETFNPDLIISDYSLPQFDGMTALSLRNEIAPLIPFIIVTASVNEEVAVNCIKAGADDYILKGNLSRLSFSVINSINKFELQLQNKIAEKALQDNELQLRLITDNVRDTLWLMDLDLKTTWISPSVTRTRGYTLEELSEMPLDQHLTSESRSKVLEISSVYLSPEKLSDPGYEVNINVELEYFRKDGTTLWADTAITLLRDKDGRPVSFLGVGRDITERKQAQEELQRSQLLLKSSIESPKDMTILSINTGYKYMYFNTFYKDVMAATYGVNVELGMNLLECITHEDDRIKVKLNYDRALGGESHIAIEEFGDLERYYYETRYNPILNAKNEIIGATAFSANITERKRAEEEIQNSFIFNESLLRTIPFGMDIVDETGSVLFLSDNFQNIFGTEAIGKKCWELYRDDSRRCSDCPLFAGINVGETEINEAYGIFGNRIFEINHTGMIYHGKKAMLEIFLDITDKKEVEKELIKAKEKAEESDRLKTAFLNNISHEIRTPMNAIVGFSALLCEPDNDSLMRQSYSDIILQSSNHLLAIISDIVDISNIDANLVKIVKKEVNINSIVRMLYEQFLPKAKEKKIRLECDTSLSDQEANVFTDNTKLTEILSNLISNALKFTDNGSIKIKIKKKNGFIEFCVKDTGIGIHPRHIGRIFDRFYQVQDSVSRLYEGTGLGLAISKAYTELLGGEIWLSTEQGRGTSFFFTIPYEIQAVRTERLPDEKSADDFIFNIKKRILVVEDIESNFRLIKYFLSKANVEILYASNGKEAVEKCLSDNNIDLVLMDIKMPVMDGFTAVKLIREANLKLPIIAQTAYIDDRDSAIEVGCNGFISKPFDKKSLLKVLAEFN